MFVHPLRFVRGAINPAVWSPLTAKLRSAPSVPDANPEWRTAGLTADLAHGFAGSSGETPGASDVGDALVGDEAVVGGVGSDEAGGDVNPALGDGAGDLSLAGVPGGLEFGCGIDHERHNNDNVQCYKQQHERQGGGFSEASEEFHGREEGKERIQDLGK